MLGHDEKSIKLLEPNGGFINDVKDDYIPKVGEFFFYDDICRSSEILICLEANKDVITYMGVKDVSNMVWNIRLPVKSHHKFIRLTSETIAANFRTNFIRFQKLDIYQNNETPDDHKIETLMKLINTLNGQVGEKPVGSDNKFFIHELLVKGNSKIFIIKLLKIVNISNSLYSPISYVLLNDNIVRFNSVISNEEAEMLLSSELKLYNGLIITKRLTEDWVEVTEEVVNKYKDFYPNVNLKKYKL